MQNANVADELSSQSGPRRHLTESMKSLLRSAVGKLKGSARRLFLAETVRELGWNRGTIRKGMHELTAGVECKDAFCLRGRKRSDKRLPNLLDDIRDIVDSNAQVDATLRTPRLYIKLTARQVRSQLIEQNTIKMKIFRNAASARFSTG
jgi:hypothetical protein